jgi:hypothetical protein
MILRTHGSVLIARIHAAFTLRFQHEELHFYRKVTLTVNMENRMFGPLMGHIYELCGGGGNLQE